MRMTAQAVANALKAGITANFEPSNQQAETEHLSELLLDMAASLEMDAVCSHSGLVQSSDKKMRYAKILGDIAWELDKKQGDRK